MKPAKREQLMTKLPKQAQPVTRVASPGAISGENGVDASFNWGKMFSDIARAVPEVVKWF